MAEIGSSTVIPSAHSWTSPLSQYLDKMDSIRGRSTSPWIPSRGSHQPQQLHCKLSTEVAHHSIQAHFLPLLPPPPQHCRLPAFRFPCHYQSLWIYPVPFFHSCVTFSPGSPTTVQTQYRFPSTACRQDRCLTAQATSGPSLRDAHHCWPDLSPL